MAFVNSTQLMNLLVLLFSTPWSYSGRLKPTQTLDTSLYSGRGGGCDEETVYFPKICSVLATETL